MKNELDGKIMTKFVRLRAKTYSHLIDESSEDKKAKRTKKCTIKKNLNLTEFHKEFIKNNKTTN